MRLAHPELPNIVTDMIEQEEHGLAQRISDATDRQMQLAEAEAVASEWFAIASLSDHPGWAPLIRAMNDQIERLRAILEKPVPDLPFRYIQGGIYALKWLAKFPELADATAMAAQEQARIVKAEMVSADDQDGA